MRKALCLVLAASFAAYGQTPPQAGSQQVYVTAIEVVADVRDVKGKVPDGLKPEDFVIYEDDVERTVVGVEYLRASRNAAAKVQLADTPAASTPPAPARRGPWQNVLYFETTLSNSSGRISAAKEMMKHVDHLVQMGTVDVVFANPSPVALVRNSRDTAAIKAALQKVASSSGTNQLAQQRRQFHREVGALAGIEGWKSSQITQTVRLDMDKRPVVEVTGDEEYLVMDPKGREEVDGTRDPLRSITTREILPYVEQEVAVIGNFRETLAAWLSTYPRHVPRNLLMVTDGFDLDPAEFYGEAATSTTKLELRTYVSQVALGRAAAQMAEVLVAGAWTSVLIPSDNYSDGWVDDTMTSGIGRVGGNRYRKPGSTPKAFFYRPHDPLNAMAEVTGGTVVPNSSHLGATLAGLDDKVKLTYQVDRKPDGKTRRIEVLARNGNLNIRTARFAMSITPDELAQKRAIGLLKGASYRGDLATEGAMEWATTADEKTSGTLRVVSNADLLKKLLPLGAKGQFRITIAVQMGKEAVVVNRAVSDYDLAEGVFRFRTPLDLPPDATAVVLVIEETTTGIWGSTRVDTATRPTS